MTHDPESLARAAGVTRRTIDRWRREGAPQAKPGEAVASWLERMRLWREARDIDHGRRGRRKVAPPRVEDDLDLNEMEPVSVGRRPRTMPDESGPVDWETEGKRALALQRLHNLEVQLGQYLPREEVVKAWTQRVMAVRTRLLALPRTLGGRCANSPPDVVERHADELVRQMLAEFVTDGPLTPAADAG